MMSVEFLFSKKEQEFSNDILITGFHGIGTTGFISIKYLIEKLSAKKIGSILTDYMPPFISTTEEGKILLPFEFYRKEKYVFFMPRFQPYRKEQREFAKAFVEWSIQNHFKKAILIGGLDARLKKNDNDKLRIVATSDYKEKHEITSSILEKGLFVTGPLALLLALYEINNFPAVALLPYAESSRGDPLAAASAINAINAITDLSIDTTQLVHDAEKIEQNLEEMVSQTKEETTEDEKGNKHIYI
jgi:uncharacterized protein